jgi:hypothetical protein
MYLPKFAIHNEAAERPYVSVCSFAIAMPRLVECHCVTTWPITTGAVVLAATYHV